jgi:hypothetical protein
MAKRSNKAKEGFSLPLLRGVTEGYDEAIST